MCQHEVLEYLIKLRKTGDNRFHSIRDIEDHLYKLTGATPRITRRKVNQLYALGFLDIEIHNGKELRYWRRRFRAKEKGV